MDLSTFDEVIIPINSKGHWIFAIAKIRSKTVHIYDSYVKHLASFHDAIISKITSFLKYAVEDDEWKGDIQIVPQQENDSDCGFFACKILDYVSTGKSLNFGQQDMEYLKKVMAYEIYKQKLIMW